jgi:hypothetical protein
MFARMNSNGDIEFFIKRNGAVPEKTLYNEAAKKSFIEDLEDEERKAFEGGKTIRVDKQ